MFGTDLTKIVDQFTFAAHGPVLEAVRHMQRSWIPPLLAQQHSALAALTKALPKIVTPSYVSQTLLGGVVPALQISVAQTVVRGLMPQQSVVRGLTVLAQTQALVGQNVLRSLALPDFGVSTSVLLAGRIADVVRPLQVSLGQMVNGLFRQWSKVAGFGVGLARTFARAALFAAMRAREAVLHGRLDEVDAFIEDWLDQDPTSWRRDAVIMVLLDGQWIPADPEVGVPAVMGQIKRLASKEARNHRWMAETQLCGYPVLMLDQPMPRAGRTQVSLADIVVDPATKDGIPIGLDFIDDRLNRLFSHLKSDEQRVVLAYGDGNGETWESAALAAGLAPECAESGRKDPG